MNPEPTLMEKTEDSPHVGVPSLVNSPPLRKDTISSISTQGTSVSSLSAGSTFSSADTASTMYGPDGPRPTGVPSPTSNAPSPTQSSPPSTIHQAIFSVKEGVDVPGVNRKASRRRTGPLSASQREKAALIRKLGACAECRRRRVACNPAHHGMSWEDLARKFKQPESPMPHELASQCSLPRPLTPAALVNVLQPTPSQATPLKALLTHDAEIMDLDQSIGAGTPPGRPPISDARVNIRTPLPNNGPPLIAPRPSDQLFGAPRGYPDKQMPLPGIESLGNYVANAQMALDRIMSGARSHVRYTAAHVLLLSWQDDADAAVAVEELGRTFEQYYGFAYEAHQIPHESSGKWLSKVILGGPEETDRRDVLKIVYYNGYSHLDASREMVLASSKDLQVASTIRWSGIQQALEENVADTLILMDTAYYPSSSLATKNGVIELIAASASADYQADLGRNTFTQVLAEQLRARASQDRPMTAAELHAIVLSKYPKMVQDRAPEREIITSFPSPLHLQTSKNPRLPSILLAPLALDSPMQDRIYSGTPTNGHGVANGHSVSPMSPTGPMLSLNISIPAHALEMDAWAEWLRAMPGDVRDVSVERAYPAYH